MNVVALPGTVIRQRDGGPAWVVLGSHRWATLAWPLLLLATDDGVPSGKLYLDPDAGCEWIFIYDPLGWVVYPTQSAWEKGRGVVQLISSDNDTWQLPQYSLSRSPKTFTFDNLCNIVEFLKLHEAPQKCSRDGSLPYSWRAAAC